MALDDTNILCVTKSSQYNNILPIDSIDDISVIKKYNLDVPDSLIIEEDVISFIPDISLLSKNVVAYIAGFVIKKLKKNIFCATCQTSLEQNYMSVDDMYFKLLNQKNRGGLMRPSTDVIDICVLVEKRLRHIFSTHNNQVPKEKKFFDVFVNKMFSEVLENKKIFSVIDEHIFDHTFMENPKTKLIKSIIICYAKIRLYSFVKRQTETIKGELIRKKLSKIILFSGQ